MPRGKIQMRRIENPVHRQVTFSKRRAGLLKKAKELSVLCDADIGIIIFSTHGKLYELATKGTMQGLIERYTRAHGEAKLQGSGENKKMEPKKEIAMLKQEINLLQKGLRYMYGEGVTGHMTLGELVELERQLEMWMYNTHSAKMHIMFQEIQQLKNKVRSRHENEGNRGADAYRDHTKSTWAQIVKKHKFNQDNGSAGHQNNIIYTPELEGILKAANEHLQEKIVEQNRLFDVAPQKIDQTQLFNLAPQLVEDVPIPYPLTIQNDMIQILGALY